MKRMLERIEFYKKNNANTKPYRRLCYRIFICLVFCVLLGVLMNQYKLSTSLYTGLLSIVFITFVTGYFFALKLLNSHETFLRLLLINSLLFFIYYIFFYEIVLIFSEYSIFLQLVIVWFACMPVIANSIVIILYYKQGRLNGNEIIALLGIQSFMLYSMYALFNPISNVSRQHDTIAFTNGGGHLGYIWYVWAYGRIPSVDPRTLWEFYQPPLYYLICGYWVKLYTLLNVPIIQAAENIQLFSLFCVMGTLIVMDELIDMLTHNTLARFTARILFILCPLFNYLAGSVNNDSLLLFLSILSLYSIVVWYNNPSFVYIVVSAVLIGLTLMTKNSGALLAPGFLVFFVFKVVKDRKVRYLVQYVIFSLISIPIGLWWNFRNVVRFRMPFVYFNPASTKSIQYIPDYTPFERLFGIHNQLNHPYVEISNTSENIDYNIWITTLKTMVFTCSTDVMLSAVTRILGTILLVLSIILAIGVLVLIFRCMVSKNICIEYKLSFFAVILAYVFFYIHFIFSEPFVHTMHARYIMPALVVGLILAVSGGKLRNSYTSGTKQKTRKKHLEYRSVIFLCFYAFVLVSYMALSTILSYQW